MPSSALLEAMASRNQAHIEELVAQNSTLEHDLAPPTCARRRADTCAGRFATERAEWPDGCDSRDSLQAVYRIVHLRIALTLDQERNAMLRAESAEHACSATSACWCSSAARQSWSNASWNLCRSWKVEGQPGEKREELADALKEKETVHDGPACTSGEPEPRQAEPEPWFSGQAGPCTSLGLSAKSSDVVMSRYSRTSAPPDLCSYRTCVLLTRRQRPGSWADDADEAIAADAPYVLAFNEPYHEPYLSSQSNMTP
ncbi:hypothetical protein B0H21DRAFT_865035 [Amylocystis lapponica]|nr:hypothetical protein B0H21DRAFT_865035 [Amylocystis lapponica]